MLPVCFSIFKCVLDNGKGDVNVEKKGNKHIQRNIYIHLNEIHLKISNTDLYGANIL